MRFKLLTAVLIALVITLGFSRLTWAQSDNEKIDEINKRIGEYQERIKRLQQEANTLSNQIAQFNAQIDLTQLQITKTEEKILLLGDRIDQLDSSLSDLSGAFSSRAVATYKITKFGGNILSLVISDNLTNVVSNFFYLRKIMAADRELLVRLQSAQNTYKSEKTEQESLQDELNEQKKVLGAQKTAKANLLSVTKSDERKYQQLLAQARTELAAFKRFVSSQGGASILSNQTKCDGWGCYYNQRDNQWGNMVIGSSGDSTMREYGCLVTSMAMVISHYGKGLTPADIASSSEPFFANTAFMNLGTWSAKGVTTTRTRVCNWCSIDSVKQKMDSELSSGRPVIVGLYSGPDHFIVIKAKSGDNYTMNDPFLENGSDKPLTDKYSLGDIKTVDYVNVN